MKNTSKDIARSLIRHQAIEALKTMAEFITTDKPTKEQLIAVRRARLQARLIQALKV